ncbi:hypothetical protein Cob_v003732 [Colletotrichum orbiculare MAFF 240422]|uniref:Uncharacterized protein n=1 Tax=Colletotrichum orbiculare (strain 104-T / ATCC 96160 / CBS 514.97 / LARS 414 / MAFF 240422) TaxID=1213857 RepID=A0A484FZ77_COLOR|nr:hypothetical protein Cob_v003732 [Colletotrichum orbiculare MAFF 240422]
MTDESANRGRRLGDGDMLRRPDGELSPDCYQNSFLPPTCLRTILSKSPQIFQWTLDTRRPRFVILLF